jgi:hypothetical protein
MKSILILATSEVRHCRVQKRGKLGQPGWSSTPPYGQPQKARRRPVFFIYLVFNSSVSQATKILQKYAI